MLTWNECECDRCTQGRAGGWNNNQWTCYFTGRYYLLENKDGPVAAHFRTGLSQVFSVGDKLYVAGDMPGVNGKLVSDTTITVTNSTTNTLTLGGSGLVHTLNNNVRLSNISPDLFLHHQGFALVPGLWLDSNGDRPSQINPNTPIVYRFDGNTVSQYATGGSGVPTFVAGTEPESGGFPTINIPIGGLYTDTVLGNPAKALLLSIKDGIDCSANVSVHPTSASGGRNSASAFDTVISSDGYTLSIIRVDEGSGGRGMFHYSGFSPSGSGTGGTNSMFYQSTSSTIGQDYTRVRSVPLHSNFTGGNPVRGGLSAGDKAQDLLGIFANSPIDTETELLGIQVPYDSLIQSSTTSPEVRNFFLTYGNVSESAKISDGNVFLGSQEMEHKGIEVDDSDSILETIGDFLVEDEDNIFSKTYDLIDGVFSAAMDLVKDVTITLMAEDGGNKGGIQIIPARLNIRYDAGERHYTYDMLLSAVNFKIAP